MNLRDLRAWLRVAPPATLVPAADVLAALEQDAPPADEPRADAPAALPTSWRERLWLVPDATRLGVLEVAEALGRPRSWVYRRTGPTAEQHGVTPLPCHRLDGELVFRAGELRAWVTAHEVAVHAPPTPVTPIRARPRGGPPDGHRRAS
ncbi:MAG TPA: hypothetical protein VGD56_01275 [Gemmatirosa sp.]